MNRFKSSSGSAGSSNESVSSASESMTASFPFRMTRFDELKLPPTDEVLRNCALLLSGLGGAEL